MRHKALTFALAGGFALGYAGLGFCADIAGTVANGKGDPVQNIRIIAEMPAGKIVTGALTNAKGKYQITGLGQGTYECKLDPLQSGFKGGITTAALGAKGMTVNWILSASGPAIASASEGTDIAQAGDPFGFSDQEFASLVVLGGSLAGGAAVLGYGAANGFSSSSTSTPPRRLHSASPGL